MSDQFTFRLPVSDTPVKPFFRVKSTITNKEYLATFNFATSGPEVESTADTPTGLQWSDALDLPFSYIPELEVPANKQFEVLEMPEFYPPIGTRQIIVAIRPWANTAKSRESPFSEAALETKMLNQTTIVFPQ